MLTKNDIEWLATTYPQLTPASNGTQIKGVLGFTGAYDKTRNNFTLVGAGDDKPIVGDLLTGSYKISIEKNDNSDRLPRLYVDDETLPHIADRHFYPSNKTACVSGVVEEARFLAQGFNFKDYLEVFVIPFLYGQKYYDTHGEWPWREYAHDTAGALESYFFAGSIDFIPVTLRRLKRMTMDWGRLNVIFKNKNRPRGHLACFCKRHDQIRRCHPQAWEGLKKLYTDIRDSKSQII